MLAFKGEQRRAVNVSQWKMEKAPQSEQNLRCFVSREFVLVLTIHTTHNLACPFCLTATRRGARNLRKATRKNTQPPIFPIGLGISFFCELPNEPIFANDITI